MDPRAQTASVVTARPPGLARAPNATRARMTRTLRTEPLPAACCPSGPGAAVRAMRRRRGDPGAGGQPGGLRCAREPACRDRGPGVGCRDEDGVTVRGTVVLEWADVAEACDHVRRVGCGLPPYPERGGPRRSVGEQLPEPLHMNPRSSTAWFTAWRAGVLEQRRAERSHRGAPLRAAPLTPRPAGRRAIVRTPRRRRRRRAPSVATLVGGPPSVLADALTAPSAEKPIDRCRQRR
jgi:hypothetical protein